MDNERYHVRLLEIIKDYDNVKRSIEFYKRFDYLFFNKHREDYTERMMPEYNNRFIKTFDRYMKMFYNKFK